MLEPEGERPLFDGRYVRVVEERWQGHPSYEVIRQLDAAAILAVTPRDDVVLVRQFRPPVRERMLEIPAGLLDVEGEDALTCAVRELHEETGFGCSEPVFLGGVFVSPGSSDQYVHLFLGDTHDEPSGDPESGIEVVRRPFDEMVAAAGTGRVRDAKTALALLLAAARRAP